MRAKSSVTKPVHVVSGGTHLLPAEVDQISSIAAALRDSWNVHYVAPVHCTGEPAFAVLKEIFGDRYIYAGLGTTVLLGPKVTVKAEAGQPNKTAMDEEDIRSYREAMMRGPLRPFWGAKKPPARPRQYTYKRCPVCEPSAPKIPARIARADEVIECWEGGVKNEPPPPKFSASGRPCCRAAGGVAHRFRASLS